MANLHSKPNLTEHRALLVYLAVLVAMGPLSIDMYVPAMPAIQRALATSVSSVHLTMSAFLTGFAMFHLICGPLADRFGRIPVLSIGTGLFFVASLGCALAESIESLMVCRFAQGVGACVGPTLGRAMTRDLFGPKDAAKALSLIAMIMALAPAVAPGLGGVMLNYAPWPSIFLFLAAYGVLVLWIIRSKLVETLPIAQSLRPINIARNYGKLLSNRSYLGVATGSALAYSGMMAYLASSGFIFINMLGVPVEYFGLVFITIVLGYMGGSALSARAANTRTPSTILRFGICLALIASLAMLALQVLFPESSFALMIPMSFYAIAMGLSLPNATALALEPFPTMAATASSLFGFLQMGLAAVVTGSVGPFVEQSPRPLLWALVCVNGLALTFVFAATSWRSKSTAESTVERKQLL
ncbi:MAG: multidrug effflux MFS transporter [Pseudomonadota bacterium]